jgi:hypothetical protein
MKKILILIFVCVAFVGNAQRISYITSPESAERIMAYDYQTPTYSSTITLIPNSLETIVKSTLTGNLTLRSTNTSCQVGDKLYVLFYASGSNRTVTLSTGFTAANSYIITSSTTMGITFIFNGTSWCEAWQNASGLSITNLITAKIHTTDSIVSAGVVKANVLNTGQINNDGNITLNTTTGALVLPLLTGVQMNALTPTTGQILYCTDSAAVYGYINSNWVKIK